MNRTWVVALVLLRLLAGLLIGQRSGVRTTARGHAAATGWSDAYIGTCGYGRFGREVVRAFHAQGLEVTVIDPIAHGDAELRTVRGIGTGAEPLVAAGVHAAVGVVAGTDADVTMVSSELIASECLAVVRTPLLARFLDLVLQPGDQLLFAGRDGALDRQQSLLRNDKVRDYVLTGRDPPGGWPWQRLERPRSTRPPAARAG